MKEKNTLRKRVVAITMDNDIWEKAKECAESNNRSLSNYLSYLVLKEINTIGE